MTERSDSPREAVGELHDIDCIRAYESMREKCLAKVESVKFDFKELLPMISKMSNAEIVTVTLALAKSHIRNDIKGIR